MQFQKTQLVQILGCTQAVEDRWIGPINDACAKFGIDTRLRLAAFIAQVGHESGRLSAVTENLNYSADGLLKTWPNRFNAAKAAECARKPEKIANVVYSSRMGNGNEASGEGWSFRGRGLIQVTGKSNYTAFSQACGINAVSAPDSLAEPTNAALSAAWFWNSKNLNSYADRQDLTSTTKIINGGTNGAADRELLYKKALIVLGDQSLPKSDEELAETPVPQDPNKNTESNSTQKSPAAQNNSIIEPRSINGTSGKSLYPWNLTFESRSGHFTEIDDTPGYERLNMTHRTGSYWEIDPTGVFTHKSVLDSYRLTKEDAYDYTGGNLTTQVKGQSYHQVGGETSYTSGGNFYVNAPRIQFNTGMLAVSSLIEAPTMRANIFESPYANTLAKVAMVAWDLGGGSGGSGVSGGEMRAQGTPVINGSFGFAGTPATEAQRTNKFASQDVNGNPITTNGIVKTAAAIVAAGAAVAGVAQIMKDNDLDPTVVNALSSAAEEVDGTSDVNSASRTPVFLKHVAFDKPTLLSQSFLSTAPDPSLYVNNVHMILDSSGVGTLHTSNGQKWTAIGEGSAKDYVDSQIGGVTDAINFETSERVKALIDEQRARNDAISDSAFELHNEIVTGLTQEAISRGADIRAEADKLQTDIDSYAQLVTEITAGMPDANIGAALQRVEKAAADLVSAETEARESLATIVGDSSSGIVQKLNTTATQSQASASRLEQLSALSNQGWATYVNKVDVLVNDSAATIENVNSLLVRVGDTEIGISDERRVRIEEDGKLGERIESIILDVGDDISGAIQAERIVRVTAEKVIADDVTGLLVRMGDTETAVFSESGAIATKFNSIGFQISGISSTATGAATNASNALIALSNMANDNILHKTEKSALITQWNIIYNERPPLVAQGTAFALIAERDAYDNAVNDLAAYLTAMNPGWSDMTQDTAIDGQAFRIKFNNLATTKSNLIAALDAKAKALADGAQGSANTANAAIGVISNDNILSMGEKPAIIIEFRSLIDENTALIAQADAFGLDRTAYFNAINYLYSYITGLNPAYNDVYSNTAIDGPVFRNAFVSVYAQKSDLANRIAAKVKEIADSKSKTTRSATAPANPAIGDTWIDISAGIDKPIPKMWNGSAWQETDWRSAQNTADISDIRITTATDISANATAITTLATRVNNGNSAPFEAFTTWEFNNSDNGWAFPGINTWWQPSFIRLTSNNGDPQMYLQGLNINGAIYDKIRARVRRIGGSGWDGAVYYTTPGHSWDGNYAKMISQPEVTAFNDWYILEWDMSALTQGGTDWLNNTITGLRFDFGNSTSDVFDVDWIAVGKRGAGVSQSNFSSVTQTLSSNSDAIGNIRAQWGINVNVNGVVSGVKLISNLIDGTGVVSKFSVDADMFEIIKTGTQARLTMSNQLLQVYDANNRLRVRLGVS